MVGSQVALDMAETSEHGGSNVQDEEVGWIAVQQGAHGFTAGTGGILKRPSCDTGLYKAYFNTALL